MNRRIWLGLILIATTYLELLVPKNWALAHHFAAGFPYSFAVAFFAFGTIILCEGITEHFGGISLLSLARGGKVKLVQFLVVTAVVGLLAEIFGDWLGKLWYYAYYPSWFYWPSLIPSFILYWVMIVETYMAAKAMWDRLLKKGGKSKRLLKYYQSEHNLYVTLGAIGTGLLLFGLISILFDFIANGFVFDPRAAVSYAPPLHHILICFLGLWFIAEAVLYSRDRPSFIYCILHGYFVPLLSLLTASTLLSFIWESQNAMVGYWVYTNWPWQGVRIFNVQVSVLLSWPTHYLIFLILPAAIVAPWAGVFWSRPQALYVKKKEKKHGTV